MLHLTTDILERSYELLRATAPFRRWNLPPADDLEFRATRLADNDQGECWLRKDGSICLTVNPDRHHTLAAALMTLAHEMIHVREYKMGVRGTSHGKVFNRLANQVCRHHGFDRGQF